MAVGKARSKRSTSGSYTSTVTTVVFVALCVLGLWMLTSNSIISPQTTARTSTTSSFSASGERHLSKPSDRRDPPVYEDTEGDLPDDAIKSDETKPLQATNDEDDKSQEDQLKSEETPIVEAGEDNNEKQEPEQETSRDNKNEEENATVVEENPPDIQRKESAEEEEKQKEYENQASEESALTQNQLAQGIAEKNSEAEETQQTKDEESNVNQGVDENKSEEKNQLEAEVEKREAESQENSQESQNQITEEDQQQRLQQQQQQEHQQKQEQENSDTRSDETLQESSQPEIQELDHFFPERGKLWIPIESKESKKSWSTQADQSENQKERRKDGPDGTIYGYTWQLCNETAGPDYIPCLDNEKAIMKLHGRKHYEHRERHCPEEPPTCLVPLPEMYKSPVEWPQSRDKIWYHNVPHTLLAEVKGHQNWVKVTGEFLTFPGGGTQFIHGAMHYIDFIEKAVPDIAWGKRTRVILDVGCGVASFGGYLFERDVLTMSFAPKDEHEAQVQFALERGIPAISAVMGSQRLPFPSRVFDVVHCARCRVPWHVEGGTLLLELNRVLRPGGYFVWSATPVYQKLKEDVEIWKEMSALTVSMCWELVSINRDKLNSVGAAIYRKPTSNDCYDQRKHKRPPMCKTDDDPNAAWYVPLQACMHRAPVDGAERGTRWPEEWPRRLQVSPYWLNKAQMGIYGRPAPDDFASDYEHWKRVVNKSYLNGLGISWSNVRNVMDMRAVYGGFAAALTDLKVWVLNVVNIDSPDTLPIIYERGLFGIYHDWCESFSTYPRTYDLLHADHLFSKLKKRCKIAPLMAEIDRIVRPGGKLIVRDESSAIGEVENLLKSLHWEVHLAFSKDQEGILSAQKSYWRPDTHVASS
ncbi:putative methyltransferase PMT27 [Vitis vinifera]|uniref:Putative methyltransferase PMT27 n=1 Tax=Vitis vinifera TaxID=29760 RepID=A0A438K5S0_VITVI|nr:putative methyltransferase PMT27 [Vitis vinifera]